MADICAQLGSFPPPDPSMCCPAPPCALEYQTKEGTASLCGHSEYVTPSSPPKKFRVQTLGGSALQCGHNANLGCGTSGISAAGASELSGHLSYSASDCSITNTQIVDYLDVQSGCTEAISYGNSTPITTVDIVPSGDGGVTVDSNPTSVIATNNGCIDSPPGSVQYTAKSGGAGPGHQKELSTEDTEDDAIDRATAPAESGWTSCSSGCTGYKTLRGAGAFSLGFRRLQVRIRIPAGTAVVGQTYEATLLVRKRVQGTSDPSVDWIEIYDTFTGEAGERIGPWLTVPVESGYEVEVSHCYNRAYG